jgi:hypothetical protein
MEQAAILELVGGKHGVVGVNLFYRDVQDLIELVNTGEASATAVDDYEEDVEEFLDENPGATPDTPGYPAFDPDSFVYTAANVGDGYVYGIEFDASTPLSAIGLPDTGVFVNYSWLDSSVDDEFGERRFNNQAKYVYNAGFIHDIPSWGFSFGASYRSQGDAFSRVLAEEVTTTYGEDLEAFVEKRFGEQLSVRLTGSTGCDEARGVQQVRQCRGPDRPRFRRIRTGARDCGTCVSVGRAVFVLLIFP